MKNSSIFQTFDSQKAIRHLHCQQDQVATDPADVWRAAIAPMFDCRRIRGTTATFSSSLDAYQLGPSIICESSVENTRFGRDKPQITMDDLDHIVITCLLNGEIRALQQGKPIGCKAGDVIMTDLSTQARFSIKKCHALHLFMPRVNLREWITPIGPNDMRIFNGKSPAAMFVRGVLTSLIDIAPEMSANDALNTAGLLPDLIISCLGSGYEPATPTAPKSNLSTRIRTHIENNLHRPLLTPALLAEETGVSRSQLFRVFENAGGVETYIRKRRLHRSLHVLRDPGQRHRSIGDIAYELGFADEAHFGRLFKKHFGLTPRAARSATSRGGALTIDIKNEGATTETLVDWLLRL
ncbi:helix-turn-helix domain-containing protein [Rhizobium sp.]|uniref:helix-turn-helix domain-containing protein n=1 Tax=Rhizobium sp. TaxID=391 RepID=UPI002AA72A7B